VLNICRGSHRTKKYETVLPALLRSYKLFKKLQASQILERFNSFHIAHSTGRSFQWYRATCHLQPPAIKVIEATFLPENETPSNIIQKPEFSSLTLRLLMSYIYIYIYIWSTYS